MSVVWREDCSGQSLDLKINGSLKTFKGKSVMECDTCIDLLKTNYSITSGVGLGEKMLDVRGVAATELTFFSAVDQHPQQQQQQQFNL